MKKISLWAKAHTNSARLMIILIHLVLGILGVQAGRMLAQTNIHINVLVIHLTLLIYVLILCVYPKRRVAHVMKSKKRSYKFHKSCDFILAFGGFLLISIFSENFYTSDENSFFPQWIMQVSASKGEKPTAEEILQSLKYRSDK
jgi:hypothetical protein